MPWLPIGPDFVFSPRDGNFRRLSRRNELGRQGYVGGAGQLQGVAVDQGDPDTIYVVERPSSGGVTAFRTRTGGRSWDAITDSLQGPDPTIDPNCIAIHPVQRNIVYLGTFNDRGIYISNNRGDTWGARNAIPSRVRKLIVDPTTAADPATTVLYAATDSGVHRSPDGGVTWVQVLAGDIWSLAAHFPTAGTPMFLAGVKGVGLFHTTDPTGTWTNLNDQGIGLPAHTAPTTEEPDGNFNAIYVDYCRRSPNRIYAWFTKRQCNAAGGSCAQVTAALFTTSAPLAAWSSVAMTDPPGPSYGFYNFVFAVAPNSPGDGANDVLFFGSISMHRSADGGQTWQSNGEGFHADQHSIGFFPEFPGAGVVPAMYIGNDGGFSMSTKFCDPAFAFGDPADHFNQDALTVNSGIFQNLNHGKQSSAIYQYNSDPAIAAIGYIGCQDTGIAGSTGALGWRGLVDADAGAIAATQGVDGVKVWGIWGAFGGFPSFQIWMWTDKGEYTPSGAQTRLGAGGPLLNGTSNYVVGLDGRCLAGVRLRDSERTLSAAITATGAQAATPSSMAGIAVGTQLTIDIGGPNQESVLVTAVTATTFTANFGMTHAAGESILLTRSFVARIGQDAIATQISQVMGSNSPTVRTVAASPNDPDILYCATSDNGLWRTDAGSTANSATVWTEISSNKPAFISISSIAIDPTGGAYVLLGSAVTTTPGGDDVGSVTSPLFRVDSGSWVHQPCTGLPAGSGFGKLHADPVVPGRLYASHGSRVYVLSLKSGVWNWGDISDGLPGPPIYDLWVGKVGPVAAPHIVLRAAIPTRGVWERDVTGVEDPAMLLYLRDNLLDAGWFDTSIEGVPNPYDPTRNVWHWHCADIKLDSRDPGAGGASPFYQTDPEHSTLPISNVAFDLLKDNSRNLPGGNRAMVHVQVHNRAASPVDSVRVWAIFCNASGGVPGLNRSASAGNAFPFWDQFLVTGDIVPSLPADSPWQSVGPPRVLSGIDAAHPRVASWEINVPLLPSGDPGHYCMVAFVHAATSPIGETNMNVDEITPRNRQVGQKNLHIGPPLEEPGGGGGGGGGGGTPGGAGIPGARRMEEYVEFHNPAGTTRTADLVFDLTPLPLEISVEFRLTRVVTVRPLPDSLTGVRRVRRRSLFDRVRDRCIGCIGWIARLLEWLACIVRNIARWLTGGAVERCRFARPVRLPEFGVEVYEAAPGGRVVIEGVRVPPHGFVAALLSIRLAGTLEPGSEHAFDTLQIAGGVVVGGSTWVVTVAGKKKHNRPDVFPPLIDTDDPRRVERTELEAEEQKYVPPWAEELVREREDELGRKLED